MIRRPPRSTQSRSSAASDVYKRQVILFPLWLGSMPALLKGFLEQLLRPGFAFAAADGRRLPKKLLAGKSARIIVTMGLPALLYRRYIRAHRLKRLDRNLP